MTSTMSVPSSQTKSENPAFYQNRKPLLSSPNSNSSVFEVSRSSSSSSPTRVAIHGRSHSPKSPYGTRSPFSLLKTKQSNGGDCVGGLVSSRKRTCVCSPTTHPGSFRCSRHKILTATKAAINDQFRASCNSSRLSYRRSAMLNSLVRIGGVEGEELARRALSSPIRPSSHSQRRLIAFEPRPSRLCVMSKAEDS
ncbi:hypothetical protein CsatA_021935 [Cannabis sativa]